jgi:hypothetical protein
MSEMGQAAPRGTESLKRAASPVPAHNKRKIKNIYTRATTELRKRQALKRIRRNVPTKERRDRGWTSAGWL